MKKIYLFLLLTLSVAFLNNAQAQDVLAGWTFPAPSGNAPITLTTECGMISTATVYADGTNGSDNWTDATSRQYFAGVIPAISLCGVTTTTSAFSLVNIGSAYNGKSIVFKLSTTNYENLILNYDTRGTGTGFTTHDWSYSTDGTSFTTFTTITGRNNTTYSSQSVDFSSVTALDNQATVYVKLTVSGASSATGNNRFDNIKFSATSTVSAPEINIASGSTNYLNNSTYNFGTVVTSTTVVTTFAVQNLGLATLNLTTASFTGGSEYVVNGAPIPATIAAGGVLTFSVEFTPTAAGTFTGVLSISSDDADENPYLFNVTGVGNVPAPEINVISGATNYLNNSTYNFGTVVTSTTVVTTFAVQNLGIAPLNLTTASFTGGSEYVVNGAPIPATVAAGDVLTFSVEFTPTTAGTFTGVLSLSSDDADENPYLFNITGVGVAALNPEINVLQSATSYTSGSTYSYSNTDQNWFTDAVFTIENIGNAVLSISTYSITGTEYSLIGAIPTSVAASSVASFTLRFAPTALGTFTGSVTLTNNDTNEGSYVVNLTGVSVLGTPAIFTENFGNPGGTSAISTYTGWSSTGLTFSGSGDIRATTVSNTYFGATGFGNAFLTNVAGRNIEISNVNTSTCSSFTLSFGVYKSATTADGSTLAVEVSSDGTNYTALTFDPLPTGAGTVGWYYRTASGTIPQAANLRIRFTNTSTLSQFRIDDLQLKGVCPPAPEINFIQGATSYLNGSTYNFGIVNTGSTNVLTFSIQNIGTATLNLTTATFTGGAAYTVISDAIPTTVAAGGIFTVTVVYSPTVAGTYTEVLTVSNNDADENPYVLNISSIVNAVAPEINLQVNSISYANNSTYSYGTVTVGGTYTAQVTLQNTGTGDLNVSNGNTTNTTEFSVVGGTPPPYTIAAGNVVTATFVFTPTANGTYTNILTINSNDSDESTYTVTFTAVATTPLPEINIKQGATNYITGSTYSFPNTTIATSNTVVFTIENTGTADLNISGTSNINSTLFDVASTFPMPLTIAAGNTATFSVTFQPTAIGTYSGSVSFTSDDADEATYIVSYTGVAQNAPAPEINVVSTSLNFGSIEENTTADLTYVVQNTGNADLVLSTSTTAPYSITGTAPTTITAGNSATYTVRFSPTTTGTYNANVTITSNDADESSLTVSATGVAVAALPAIFTETFGTPTANTAIASYTGWSNLTLTFTGTGDVRTTSASSYTGASGSGNVFLTTGGTKNIEISNINTSSCTGLSLAFGVFKNISGANGSELLVEVSSDGTNYTALTFPALPTGTGWNYVTTSGSIPQAANLRIRFTNTSTTVQYRIDDVKLKGSCAPAPEINIVQSATTYLSGSTYNFGTAAVSSSNVVIFTIQNTGNADLNISNSTDAGAAEFTTTSTFPIPLTIAAGNTATFSVTFAPTAVGTYNGSITFDNNDSNEPAYVLSYTGVASTTTPEINLTQNGANFLTGATHSFGSVNQGTTNLVTFTVQNTGTASLTLSTYSFTGSSDFSYSTGFALPATILAGQSSTFTVTLSATAVGTITGAFSFSNDDASENPYLVNVSATVVSTSTVTAPEINVKQATTSIASSGTHDFGSVTTGTKDVVFTIENTGTAALTISSNTISGAQYSLVGAMPTSVAAGSTADFTVQFSSTTPGAYVGSITIVNDDANEASYVINFTASVPTSIEEAKADDVISIYPNPNKGTILNFTKATDATIYNAIGAKVMEVKNADKVDVSVLENGIYMVNINNKTKRLIIAK